MKIRTIMKALKEKQFRVVRVSKTEFELNNGDVYPFPFDMDEELTVEEFQKILDGSKDIILQMLGDVDND